MRFRPIQQELGGGGIVVGGRRRCRIDADHRLYHFAAAAAAAHRSRLWLRRRPLRLQFRRRLRRKRFPLAVRHPRPLQRLVYAVQVDGVVGRLVGG